MDLEKLIEMATAIEEKVAKLTAQKVTTEEQQAELQAKLTELGEKQAELARKMLTLQQSSQKKPVGENVASLGQQFVESTQYADFMAGRTTRATFSSETPVNPVSTPAGAVQKDYRGIRGAPMLPATASSVFLHVPTSSNSISYLKEDSFTNSAAETAEGTQKSESTISFSEADATVRTIAHFIRITKQLAEDAPALAAYINVRMTYGLERRVEKQLLNGDGSKSNLSGIFNTGNYTAHGFTDKNMPANSNELDLIRRCGAVMRKSGYWPNVLFLNPMDFDTLRGMKDNNGQYLMGSPLQSGTDIRPWGFQVVESPEVTEGKFMLADSVMGATIYDRSAPVIEMFEQDSDNVQKNLYTIRAEQRMAFAVESANCFIGGELKIASTTTTE